MEPTIAEVELAIAEILGPGAEVDLRVENDRTMGLVSHPAFQGLDVAERHALLWNGLRKRFEEKSTGIGVLLLFSPTEYHQIAS